jgi:hypothetical protein
MGGVLQKGLLPSSSSCDTLLAASLARRKITGPL